MQEDNLKLQQEFEEMKYSGKAKLFNGQRTLEKFQTHLEEKKIQRD